jgi:hypothetical protein
MVKGPTSQNIQLQIQLGCANTVIFLFRPDIIFQTPNNQQLYYNSLCGYNPFAAVEASANNDATVGYGASAINVSNMLVSNNPNISIQLQIGNDYKPRTPIRTVKEIGSELQKALHGLNQADFGINVTSNILFDRVGGSVVPVYDIYSDGGFLTTFIPVNLLQDQTKVYNPMLTYGTNPDTNVRNTKNITPVSTDSQTQLLQCVTDYTYMKTQTAPVSFFNVNQFTAPSSNFMLGFDLDMFYGMTGKAQSGTYLGNFQTTLNMTGLEMCKNQTVFITAIYYHQLRLSIQMGGTVTAYK